MYHIKFEFKASSNSSWQIRGSLSRLTNPAQVIITSGDEVSAGQMSVKDAALSARQNCAALISWKESPRGTYQAEYADKEWHELTLRAQAHEAAVA